MILFIKYFTNIIINFHNIPTEVDVILQRRKHAFIDLVSCPKVTCLPSLSKGFRENRKVEKYSVTLKLFH